MTSDYSKPPTDAVTDLLPIDALKAYGVGRTLAFAKMKVGGPQHDPSFPTSLFIHGRHYFVRAEILQWALGHRRVTKAAHVPADA